MMMDSSPGSKAPEPSPRDLAGTKRPAPSLLPAFEPLSSSPALPRPSKRQNVAGVASNAYLKYPTPAPTSSTGILSSSPPRVQSRPGLQRTQSIVSERAPLSAVPSIELNENGETLLMGRSSNSSQYQLSANRLISRVHVKARYIAASNPLEPNKVEIICNGWNGLKLHCQGRTWELAKGDTFTSETENAEIMIDVQDARVLVNWPKKDRAEALGNLSDSSWDDSPRSARNAGGAPAASGLLQSSPLRRTTRIKSPESPTPANHSGSSNNDLSNLLPDSTDNGVAVEIYEDASADEEPELPKHSDEQAAASFVTEITNSFSSDLSDPLSEDENDPNEENDPIIHSFGPFGANLNNRLASFTTESPKKGRSLSGSADSITVASASRALSAVAGSESTGSTTPRQGSVKLEDTIAEDMKKVDVPTITNHVVNQLAFSRLSSNPLTTIMSNLPAEEKRDLTKDVLRRIIETTICIGIIPRQGKDAAGKPLESEYYYVPEADTDDNRRAAVVDGLRKPSLRNCRKHHVVSIIAFDSCLQGTGVVFPAGQIHNRRVCHDNEDNG